MTLDTSMDRASDLLPATVQPYLRFTTRERDRRWKAIRERMAREGLHAIVTPANTSHAGDWQADSRYISHVGGGLNALVGVVFPLKGEVTVAAYSAHRWGPQVQDWVTDLRETHRRPGKVMAERLLELGLENGRIGLSGLGQGTRSPEGIFLHGTYTAIREAVPHAEFVDASDLLQDVRMVKSAEEIEALQRSTDLVEHAIEAQRRWAQPGVPDYRVWAESMHAMFSRGSEFAVHFNWRVASRDTLTSTTLSRPTWRPLERGDVILAETESSILGYRAQQWRPVAVHEAHPELIELAKLHVEFYGRVLEFLRPGVTAGELATETERITAAIAPKAGPLAGVGANMTMHGRGLGDDRPLVLMRPGGKIRYEQTLREWDRPYVENGVYILKPSLRMTNGRQYRWGDTIHLTKDGARRMGKSEIGLTISEPTTLEWEPVWRPRHLRPADPGPAGSLY
jgi:Xaa-Pro aminopeptidase